MKTALLTAVGSASAGMVIERLHALGLRVVGCDIYPRAWNVASGEVDVFSRRSTPRMRTPMCARWRRPCGASTRTFSSP